eukprot:TRINITY_DN111206_c0_g1_i1.p1 TRINITY_DN111206_c0_g1~~TRINITY_DN111206_c0_g1_i1.p1  ORF type:complete len:909 (+),score=275.77 TRINITY_DN111206_c0_g1_i1:128-2854(+)
MPPKGKAKVAVKLKAGPAKPQKKADAALPVEVKDLAVEIFKVADEDCSGSIQFHEFLHHHRAIVNLAGGSLGGAVPVGCSEADGQGLEKRFRELDEDHNLSLDEDEFVKYMVSIFSITGLRTYVEICQALLTQSDELKALRGTRPGYDAVRTDELLEKLRVDQAVLSSAARMGVEKLLDAKGDPNFLDRDGANALYYAAGKADESLMIRLIEAGADPKVLTKKWDTAVFQAAINSNFSVLRYLLLGADGRMASKQISQDGGDSLPLGKDGASRPGTAIKISVEDADKCTNDLLKRMDSLSQVEVAELIKKKADVNHRDEKGWTPITMATFFAKQEVLDLLLRHVTAGRNSKFYVNRRDARGRSALHMASRKVEACALIPSLIKNRADVDAGDNEGWTALHHAAFNGVDEAVKHLVNGGASVHVRGFNGFTPWMAMNLPQKAGHLGKAALEKLEPPPTVAFKHINSVLSNDALSVYEKLDSLMTLQGVANNVQNLRLYEQFFPSTSGPNKVRLSKVWEQLAKPLLRRMRTQEVDMEAPGPNVTDNIREEALSEIIARKQEQEAFVLAFLNDTKGPRPLPTWKHENRACIQAELTELLQEELDAFKRETDKIYEALVAKDGGKKLQTLLGTNIEEVFDAGYLSQLGAHPLPTWIESLDSKAAFEAFWNVQAANMPADGDDAVVHYMELLASSIDLEPGARFWRNAYRFWLAKYVTFGDSEFHSKMTKLVDGFSTGIAEEKGWKVKYNKLPTMDFDEIMMWEMDHGVATHKNFAGRTLAAKVLDIVRGTIVVCSPLAAIELYNECFAVLQKPAKQNLRLVRVRNSYHPDAESVFGLRCIEMTFHFKGNPRKCPSGQELPIEFVAQVQIYTEASLDVRQRSHIAYKCWKGHYDWPDSDGLDSAKKEGSLEED